MAIANIFTTFIIKEVCVLQRRISCRIICGKYVGNFYVTKLFLFRPEEVQHIVSGKLALKYQGSEIEAMKEVAQASKNRSLAEFQSVSISSLLILITVPKILRKF